MTLAYEDELASSLRWDGDTFDAPDGSHWRLRFEPDYDTSINDFDCYGRTEWRSRSNDYGHSTRPPWFTGAARIIKRDRWDDLWWEPHRDGRKVYDSPEDIHQIRELAEYGFQVAVLERFRHCDCCQHDKWETVSAMGGIEPINTADFVTDIVHQLLDSSFEEL